MLTKNIKAALITAIFALGVAGGLSTHANAHDNRSGIQISGKHGQIFLGHRGGHRHHGHSRRHHSDYYYGGRKHRSKRHHRRYGHCGPRRALDKAWRMGVNRPHVARIGDRRLVVKGRSRGHRATVVFARLSKNCAVIGTGGLGY